MKKSIISQNPGPFVAMAVLKEVPALLAAYKSYISEAATTETAIQLNRIRESACRRIIHGYDEMNVMDATTAGEYKEALIRALFIR